MELIASRTENIGNDMSSNLHIVDAVEIGLDFFVSRFGILKTLGGVTPSQSCP